MLRVNDLLDHPLTWMKSILVVTLSQVPACGGIVCQIVRPCLDFEGPSTACHTPVQPGPQLPAPGSSLVGVTPASVYWGRVADESAVDQELPARQTKRLASAMKIRPIINRKEMSCLTSIPYPQLEFSKTVGTSPVAVRRASIALIAATNVNEPDPPAPRQPVPARMRIAAHRRRWHGGRAATCRPL